MNPDAERAFTEREKEQLAFLVELFVGCRDAEFVEALARRLLAAVGR